MNNPVKRGSDLESLLHSEHRVTIEKMSIGGDGVARIPFADRNVVVFVPQSAPQDQLKIKITAVEKTLLRGEILQIEKPGPSRRNPPCPYAKDCGGCSWQQFDETEQIHQKELLLKELFQKFLPQFQYSLLPTVSTAQKFEYRNRIQLKHLQNKLGYFKPYSHDIVPIADCLISEPLIRSHIGHVAKTLKPTPFLKKYELKVNQNGKVEHYEIGEKSEGLAFSQVNNSINELLVQQTLKLVLPNTQTMTELYAGSGNFTFALARQLPQLHINAVELNERLTSNAAETIKKEKWIKRINFFTTKSEIFANNYPLSKDLVLLDPPRSGCHPDVMKKVAEFAPQQVIYVSCHPTMLVRDLALLLKNHPHYRIQHLQIFDMFPQTDHFETLCVLSKVT